MPLHVNYSFCVDFAAELGGRILDYGCGAGQTIREGLSRNLDIWGAETFYEGGSYRTQAGDLIGGRIVEIADDRLPFPDGHFDCIFSNQVFEHVPNLSTTLTELRRVIKPGGRMLSLFPSRDVLRDGHCNIALAHRFKDFPSFRRKLIAFQHRLGMGANRHGESSAEYADIWAKWIDEWCYYRPYREIVDSFRASGFSFERIESEYIKYRWGKQIMPSFAFRLLAGIIVSSLPTDNALTRRRASQV